MPFAVCQTKSASKYQPEQVWERHWAACDVDREIATCEKHEIAVPILSCLNTLNDPLIVDCGCGPGVWIRYLQQKGFRKVIGVDSFTPAVLVLQDQGGQAVVGDVRQLPFDNASVDVCLSLGVVEHFPEGPASCLAEMIRILIPGGYLFLTVPYHSWMRRLVAHPVRRLNKLLKHRRQQFFEYRFSRAEIIEFCRCSGFEVLSSSTDDYLSDEMSLGLWLDIPFLRSGEPGELNRLGVNLCRIFRRINPWLISAGILIIARKPKQPDSIPLPVSRD